MTKQELIIEVANGAELTKKDATKAVDAFINAIEQTVKSGEKVQLVGFGSFELKERAERMGRNPASGKEMLIPASKAPAFKAGKSFKDFVNE